jgi:hypothetical protein
MASRRALIIAALLLAASRTSPSLAQSLQRQSEMSVYATIVMNGARQADMSVAAQWLFEKCAYVPSGHIRNLEVDDDELLFFKRLRSGT